MPTLCLDLRQLTFLLAHTVDLVGVDDYHHGRRVGMFAVKLARRLGWDDADQHLIYDAGLLHDCGVSKTREHRHVIDEFQWLGAQAHCRLGAERLAGFAPLAHLAPIVRAHHTPWMELPRAGCGPATASRANLIFLSDRIDALCAAHGTEADLLHHAERLRDRIRAHRGSLFAPDLVDAFLEASEHATFWADRLSPQAIQAFQAAMGRRPSDVPIDWPRFKEAAHLFQEIVDAKSPFTSEHSLGVARLARLLAERAHLGAERCEMVEIAGLMHDLGKLQVPDELLEAPRALTDPEYDTMRAHSFVTFELLREVAGLEEVTRWAASHHEKLDGSGYPFGLRAEELPQEARMVAVADIYQALAQDRPYRAPMAPGAILEELHRLAEAGLIDGTLVEAVAADPAAHHEAAVGVAVSAH